jgi:hypothetical protein
MLFGFFFYHCNFINNSQDMESTLFATDNYIKSVVYREN